MRRIFFILLTCLTLSVTAQTSCDTLVERYKEIAVQTEIDNEAYQMENNGLRVGILAAAVVAFVEFIVIIIGNSSR